MYSSNQKQVDAVQNKMSSEKTQKLPKEDMNLNTFRNQYMIAISRRLEKIQNQMIKDFHLNYKFINKLTKFSSNYTREIAMSIMAQLTQEKNEIQGEQKQEVMKNLGRDIHNVIKSILTQIHSEQENNNFDDIIFNSQMPQNCSEQIILKLKDQIEKDNEGIYYFWILKDYLELDTKAKGGSDNKQEAIHIFELKRNPFTKSSKTKTLDQMKKQIIQKVKNATKEKSTDIKTYAERFVCQCLQNNMLFNISQIIKLLYASVNGIYEDFSELQITRSMRFQNKFNYSCQLSKKSHPKIIMYYVINNKMEQKQVVQNFQFFKPFLRHFFKRERAVLHIIGFSEKNETEELKLQMKKMMKKINQLEKQMKQLRQKKKEQI